MEQKRLRKINPESKESNSELFEQVVVQTIESVDRKILQEIFDERLKMYGVTDSRELFPKDNFAFNLPEDKKAFAAYSNKDQKLNFSPFWLEKRFNIVDPRIGICMIECHEQTHHLSHRECTLVSENEKEVVTRTIVGLDEYYSFFSKESGTNQVKNRSMKIFSFLNEGLTEMFSREILIEYLKRDTQFADKKAVEDFFQKLPDLELVYNPVVKTVEQIIDAISERVGIEQSVIRESLFAAMFRDEEISDPELVEAFNELFGNGFIQKLAHQRIKDDTSEILNHLAK